MQRFFILLASLALLLGGPAMAQPVFPERGTAPVVDGANIIDPAMEAQLTARLEQFEQANQRQFVIATVPDLQGYDIADYGYQLGRHWGLGDAENNDGIILLVAPKERRVRIEVGYGLESIMPDGMAYNIVERDIVPRFKEGDMQGGIVAGAGAILTQLELPPEEAAAIAAQAGQSRYEQDGSFPFGILIWGALMFFFFIRPIMRGNRGRRYGGSGIGNVILWSALNNMSGGGGSSSGGGGFSSGGGGGGFSGGGGSFGGGGASGSW